MSKNSCRVVVVKQSEKDQRKIFLEIFEQFLQREYLNKYHKPPDMDYSCDETKTKRE